MARRGRSETASALMLVPAGMLILLVLASISADSALAFMAQRQLESEVSAVANDAATVAVPNSSVNGTQSGDQARPAAQAVAEMAVARIDHEYSGGLRVTDVRTNVNDDTVTVSATGRVRYIFAAAIPGADKEVTVRARSTAQLQFR